MRRFSRNGRLASALLLVTALGCGVGRKGAGFGDSEEALRARVTAFWDMKVARDVVKMYDFIERSYREKTSLADYVGCVNRDLKFHEYRIESIQLQEAEATVFMSYSWQLPDYVLMGLKPAPKLMHGVPETWKLEDHFWNRVVEDTKASRKRGPRGPKAGVEPSAVEASSN